MLGNLLLVYSRGQQGYINICKGYRVLLTLGVVEMMGNEPHTDFGCIDGGEKKRSRLESTEIHGEKYEEREQINGEPLYGAEDERGRGNNETFSWEPDIKISKK